MAGKTKYSMVLAEDRRARISIGKNIKKLTDIQEELENNGQGMGAAQIGAMRLRADISMGLLKKCLPDLKAIEHSGSIGDKPLEEMTDAELAAELTAIRSTIDGNAGKTSSKAKSTIVH